MTWNSIAGGNSSLLPRSQQVPRSPCALVQRPRSRLQSLQEAGVTRILEQIHPLELPQLKRYRTFFKTGWDQENCVFRHFGRLVNNKLYLALQKTFLVG